MPGYGRPALHIEVTTKDKGLEETAKGVSARPEAEMVALTPQAIRKVGDRTSKEDSNGCL
jgi:hypothetical protein